MITMKRRRHTPEQVVGKLAEGERILNGGGDLAAVLRTLEISEATWNRWRSQYGGMKASEAKRLKELEAENRVFADPGLTDVPAAGTQTCRPA